MGCRHEPEAEGAHSARRAHPAGGSGLSGSRLASLLIDAGANAKAVQEYMGHSKIQTTFDTYGHLLPGSRDQVRERMDAYLGAAGQVVERVAGATS